VLIVAASMLLRPDTDGSIRLPGDGTYYWWVIVTVDGSSWSTGATTA